MLGVSEQASDQQQAKPAPGSHGREGVPEIVDAHAGQPGVLADGSPAGPQLGEWVSRLFAGKDIALIRTTPGSQLLDQLQCRCAQGQLMIATLLRIRGWLDPETGLGIELLPGGLHRLAWPAAGQQDEPQTVGRFRPSL